MKQKESISARLRRLRNKKGLTLKAVASAINVPVSTYKEWEYGRAIQGEPYQELAQCFGVSLSELIIGQAQEGKILSLSKELKDIKERIDFLDKELLSLI